MIQSIKSASSYQGDILLALMNSGITMTSPGGKARAFCDIVGSECGAVEANAFSGIAQVLLPFATGSNLDYLGWIWDIERLGQVDATSTSSDQNFEFYVLRGTFGAINNGADILVPAGTQIYTSDGVNGVIMVTSSDVVCPASQSSVYFGVQCLTPGSAGVAASNVYVSTNFTNYTDSVYGSLLVTNNYGLVEGRDVESDDDYRYRINLKLQSPTGNTEGNIRLAVLQVPGIQDLDFEWQAGTFTTYVYGVSPVVSQNLLSMTQAAMDGATAFPLTGTAVAPDLIGISYATSITLAKGSTQTNQQNAIANAVNAGTTYINNLAMGQEFVINELETAMMTSDSNIVDVGTPNKPINDIFIWRSRADGSRYSRYLVNNYTPALGERIFVENSIANPISISIATS